MQRGFVFAFATVTVLAVLWSTPTFAQPPAATPPGVVVQPLPPTPTSPGTVTVTQPGTVVVQPAPGTVVVQPAPGTVVQPAPGVVVQPAPAPGVVVQPGAPPVGTPLTCPECRGALIQGQRYLPPSVSVCIPGPPNYGPGPFLVTRYNAVSGPPYPIPTFTTTGTGLVPMPAVRPIVSVSYVTGRTSEVTITAPSGQTFPADVRVQTVTDTAYSITWDVKSTSVSPDRRTLTVVMEGKGLPKSVTTPPESGNLTVTLGGAATLPTLQPVPVVYVTPR
jgi:hypothetical protein